MNKDQFEGKWRELKGKAKEKWGKLTDNDLRQIDGKYDQFLGFIQKHYGYSRERAEQEFNNWNWGKHGNSHEASHANREREEHGKNRFEAGREKEEYPRERNEKEQHRKGSEQNRRDDENKEKRRKAG